MLTIGSTDCGAPCCLSHSSYSSISGARPLPALLGGCSDAMHFPKIHDCTLRASHTIALFLQHGLYSSSISSGWLSVKMNVIGCWGPADQLDRPSACERRTTEQMATTQ